MLGRSKQKEGINKFVLKTAEVLFKFFFQLAACHTLNQFYETENSNETKETDLGNDEI